MNTPYQPIYIAQKDMDAPPAQPASQPGTAPDGSPPPQPRGEGAGGGWSMFIMLGVMILIFYLLIFRPQQKKAKEHQKLISGLKKGDEVITNSGILGRIAGLGEKTVTVEIAQGVKVKVLKSQVAGYQGTELDGAGSGGKTGPGAGKK